MALNYNQFGLNIIEVISYDLKATNNKIKVNCFLGVNKILENMFKFIFILFTYVFFCLIPIGISPQLRYFQETL